MSVVRAFTPEEMAISQQTAQAIAIASQTVQSNQFVFFAAFDGTNNDRSNPAYSGDSQAINGVADAANEECFGMREVACSRA